MFPGIFTGEPMNTPFVAALDSEIASLETALNQDVRFVRLREVRRLRELYSDGEPAAVTPTQAIGEPTSRPPLRRTDPERLRALEAARLLLANKVGPVPTAELYEHVKSLDIVIKGKDPQNNLSAMLSNSGMFKANGRSGWTLRASPAAETETETKRDADGIDWGALEEDRKEYPASEEDEDVFS